MGLVATRCTQCGAEIDVDENKESGICRYCGTPFITEKVLQEFNTYVTNNEIHNYAGATINIATPDNPEYLCPKCQSVETRAIKLNTHPPKLLSHKTAINWCMFFLILFVLGVLQSITVKNFSEMFLGGLLVFGLYRLLGYYKRKQDEDGKINQRNLYAWNRTFRCLRCGEIFLVEDSHSR